MLNTFMLAKCNFEYDSDIYFVRIERNELIIPLDRSTTQNYNFYTCKWEKHIDGVIESIVLPEPLICEKLTVLDNTFFDLLMMDDNIDFTPLLLGRYKLNYYRDYREKYVFPIINRGKLWYDHLTFTQIDELNTWYEKWLDIDENFKMPAEPAWLNNKLSKIEEEELL